MALWPRCRKETAVKIELMRKLVAVLLIGLTFSTNVFALTAAPASLCTPGGFVLGFFNGVFNTKADAISGLSAIKAIDVSANTNNESVKYELFYNQTGMDRAGVTRFEDLVETFRQRAAEQGGVLSTRWELFWEVMHGETNSTSIAGTIGAALSSLADLFTAAQDEMRAQFVQALVAMIGNPPTVFDYAAHRTLLDAHITQKEKMILVAHSQGNLFMNAAFEYAAPRMAANSLKAVHIAPASPTLHGDYTLANLDLIINALRLTGSVPANNVTIPGLAFRPSPFDPSGHELVATYLDQRMLPYGQIAGQLQNAFASAVTPPDADQNSNGFFTVTLTWDGAGDIDLHTFEPQGAHVYYSAKQGAAGVLDTDNTNANGPEHYYASCDATKLQTGSYSVGINNYSRGLGRTATLQVSTKRDGVLLTRSMGVGAVRGSAGNNSPLPAVQVTVALDPQGSYKVSAQ